MNTSLTAISAFCAENIGSLRSIEYASTAWVNQSTYDQRLSGAYNWQSTIEFTEEGWKKLPILPGNEKLWSEAERQTTQGKHYEQTVQAITPKMRPEVSGELMKMRNHRYLIRLTDKNGQPWILGTLEHPFRLIAAASTGSNTAGYNNYSLQFRNQTPTRAAGYVPVL